MKKNSFVNNSLLIVIITIIFLIIYAVVQQTYRTGANDPQMQMAQEINSKLEQNRSIEKFFADTIDIAQSLSVFNVLYDYAGKPIRSSGYLNNKMPELPQGVLEFAKKNTEHDVTWQPEPGVRMAMVIVSSNSAPVSFVASGRSLQEVEMRVHDLITIIFFGWMICVALVLLQAAFNFHNGRKTNFKNT